MRACTVFIAAILLLTGISALTQQDAVVWSGPPPTLRQLLTTRNINLTESSLVEALRNPDPEVRSLAALVLAEDKARDTLPAIQEALQSEKVPQTKTNIALALAELGEQKGFATLESMCGNRDVPAYLRGYATIYMLDLHHESCLGAIFEVLQSDSDTRALALSQLPKFSNVSEDEAQRIVTVTLAALADVAPSVRISASAALSRLAPSTAISALETALATEQNAAVKSQMEFNLRQLQSRKSQ